MVATKPAIFPQFPDDPRKWDGWSKYQSASPYERLCLDARTNPSIEQVEQNCAALLQWWQKKLPLKNQPSNPLAQLLGRGIDDSSRYLVQARMELTNPVRRREIDNELAAQARRETLAEFARYIAFSISHDELSAEAEANLTEFGQRNGLNDEEIRACIDEELERNNAQRAAPVVEEEEVPAANPEAEKEYLRILGLGQVDLWSATDSVRQVFMNVAQNLGIHLERAERLLDDYLDKEELTGSKPTSHAAPRPKPAPAVQIVRPAPVIKKTDAPAANFTNSIGVTMMVIPPGEFIMGSEAIDAAPNEQPLTPVKLSGFFISRYPITNAQFEQFDPAHRQKRMHGAGEDHPVVHVTSFEAIKFCQWLEQRETKKYHLPTEAQWEYAARGTDGRKYPWGNNDRRSDLANFADASTTFPWRDPLLHDGYPESSPVGKFPRGASFFGIEDMAGNVWEWCLDFFSPLAGSPKNNPRGPTAGSKRVYRGGSWKSRFTNLRATVRGSNAPNYSCNDLGFRIACEL